MTTPTIDGHWDPAFTSLAEILADGLGAGELGLSCAIRVDGRTVFNAWGGFHDRSKQRAWSADSLCCVFSVTKSLAALAALDAVATGELALDDPLEQIWAEFAAHGKGAVTLRQVLAHQAGAVGCRRPLQPEDFYTGEPMARALAAEAPWWAPGTAHGYHARTFGVLLDQILKFGTGESLPARLQRRFGLGQASDLYLGLPQAAQARCVELMPARATATEMRALPESSWEMLRAMADPTTPTGAAFQNPKLPRSFMNEPSFRSAAVASSGAHGTAEGLARLFERLYQALPASLAAEARQVHAQGQDQVLLTPTTFGLGLMLDSAAHPLGLGPGSFGHVGAGGSVLFALDEPRVVFVFMLNRLRPGVMTWGPTAQGLLAECLRALGR